MASWLLKFKFPALWLLLSGVIGGYCYYLFFKAEDKTALLPGITTDGHHQIEMECSACHTDEKQENIFTSSGVPNSACMDCHGEDLEKFSDSHPVRKFKNPENAVFIQHIDAMKCITCHGEHNQKITGEMSVTIPADYCAHCHEVTLENLDSHKNLAYDTCHTAGCHNYHDNQALAPSYLLKHYGESDVLDDPRVPELPHNDPCPTLASLDPNGPLPESESCASCHDEYLKDFKKGKHGMRLAFKALSPMSPAMARRPMKDSAAHSELSCFSCHKPQEEDRNYAAYGSCIECHDDEHTNNYKNSSHFTLWQAEIASGVETRTGVSCATCHMPRIERDSTYLSNHDQTANLTPNEKMLQSVCTSCHGLQFSMDALSNPETITENFSKRSPIIHPGIEWTADAAIKRGDEKTKAIRAYLEKNLSNTENKN